jgi:trehalose 6-phosphate phosphatase
MMRGAGNLKPTGNGRSDDRATRIELDRAALFLDLDGTLAPIASTPAAVSLDGVERALLSRAAKALAGRLAVISGRTLDDVDRILGPGLPCVAGVHGLQRRTSSGRIDTAEAHPGLGEARHAFGILANEEQGLLLEDKGLSIALHYRQAPGAESAVHELSRHLTERTGLILQSGDMVCELRTPGPDKGDAATAFMAERPFIGALPLFVGDDATDEAGFAVAEEMGGFGILVGAARKTQASTRLDSPGAVLRWIETSLTEGAFSMVVGA